MTNKELIKKHLGSVSEGLYKDVNAMLNQFENELIEAWIKKSDSDSNSLLNDMERQALYAEERRGEWKQ